MKNQTTNQASPSNKAAVAPALTRALRASIHSERLEEILRSAGASKFRGTPFEVMEEVAAAETATWISGYPVAPLAASPTRDYDPKVVEAAAACIDEETLTNAVELVGIHGTTEIGAIKDQFVANLSRIAVEATRFAAAEERPVCHNVVAVGCLNGARALALRTFEALPANAR